MLITLDLSYQRDRLADIFATLKRGPLSVAEHYCQA
jgi:hypothetical protein